MCSCKKNKPVQQEVKTPVTIDLSQLTKPTNVTLTNLVKETVS